MTPRTGRPKSNNPKGDFVAARLDSDTIRKLDEAAEALQLTRSDVIRAGIERIYEDIKK